MARKYNADYFRQYYREHREERLAADRERALQWTPEQREERRQYNHAYYKAHSDKYTRTIEDKEERNRRRRERYATDAEFREKCRTFSRNRNKESKRNGRIRADFGITVQRYNEMLAEQGGRCAICRAEHSDQRGHRLSIDHCHTTGRVRGLLCSSCNMGIGKFRDSIDNLKRAIDYLDR